MMNKSGPASAPAQVPEVPSSGKPSNPYVGPRPFRRDELFFGREREATSLVNTLLSCRVVLLHSPSGAGKTSLVQTSVVPAFESRRFQICAATDPVLSALRVNLQPPTDVKVKNRYVFSVVNGLVGHLVSRADALDMTIQDAMLRSASHHGPNSRQLIVLDQMEEVLRLDPGDLKGQSDFFRQLGVALDDDRRWALLAMREDYMGGLDLFRQYLPGQLRTTFRLDLLDEGAALRAIQEPTRRRGITFDDEAARMLVTDLRQVHSGVTDGPTATTAHPYVEPVLLQVVCYSLFRTLSKAREETFTAITTEDVRQFRPFDKALSKYYRAVVREAARDDPAAERRLREWIDQELITRQSLRKQARSKPRVADPDAALASLQSGYLIRDDPRPGGTWWELSHDMLVGPILEDNRSWWVLKLQPWQVAEYDWRRSGHDSSYLVRGTAYLATPSPRRKGLTDSERAFIRESAKVHAADGTLNRLKAELGVVKRLLILSLLANLVLLVLLLWRWL